MRSNKNIYSASLTRLRWETVLSAAADCLWECPSSERGRGRASGKSFADVGFMSSAAVAATSLYLLAKHSEIHHLLS